MTMTHASSADRRPKLPCAAAQGVALADDRQAGVTLVELLVAVLLGAILTTGLFALFSGQSTTYTRQIERMNVQGNLWGTMEYLQRQIRLAGYGVSGVCPGKVVRQGTAAAAAQEVLPALVIYNACDLMTTDPSTCCSNRNLGQCSAGMATDLPDSFAVTINSYVNNANWTGDARLMSNLLTTGTSFDVNSADGLVLGSRFVLWDARPAGAACVLRQLTAAPSASGANFTLSHNSSAALNGPNSLGLPDFPTFLSGSRLFALGPNTLPRYFAVDRAANPPRLVTWTTANANPGTDRANQEIVAEGIEDLQLSYACDADGTVAGAVPGDGVYFEGQTPLPAARQGDEWAFNAVGETAPNCNGSDADRTIKVVRITIVGRDKSAEPGNKVGKREAAEDRPAGTAVQDQAQSHGGSYGRSVLTVQVRTRNLLTL